MQVVKWIDGLIKEKGERMREITIKWNTRELTRQLNRLDVSGMSSADLKRFIQENLEVVRIGSGEDIRLYLKLRE